MKRINLSWTNNRDVQHPTDEPNPAHVEGLDRGKACPNFFKPTQRFGAKIVSPGTPHGHHRVLGHLPNPRVTNDLLS